MNEDSVRIMVKSKKSETKKSESESAPTFEESLAELQQIVSDLEDGTLGLKESMQRFEKGIVLLRSCYQILEQAEQKIEILTGTDADGNPITAPFDASATIKRKDKTAGGRKRKTAAEKTDDEHPDADEKDSEKTLF